MFGAVTAITLLVNSLTAPSFDIESDFYFMIGWYGGAAVVGAIVGAMAVLLNSVVKGRKSWWGS